MQASIHFHFLAEAFDTAAYVINRMPTPVLANSSPFERLNNRLNNRSPDYTFLRVFGCACYPNLRPYNANKLLAQVSTLYISWIFKLPQRV